LPPTPQYAIFLIVRVFKNKRFSRFADKEGITDGELLELVDRLEAGQAEADLGGNVYKLRTARQGEGRSGGFRVIVFYRSEERTFFVHGFAKSDMSNISQRELSVFRIDAKKDLALTDEQIQVRLKNRTLIEIFEEA